MQKISDEENKKEIERFFMASGGYKEMQRLSLRVGDPIKEGIISEGDVAYLPNIISEEDLPYKYVFYPGHYGAYFAFSNKRDTIPCFCSCAKESIETYVFSRISKGIPPNADPTRAFILDSMYFPLRIVEDLLSRKVAQDKTIINELKFKDNLCHVCNKKIPKYEYCHEMYGGKFKRMYGWYINLEKFRLGIDPVWDIKKISIDNYPEEIKELLDEMKNIQKPLNYWQLRQGSYSEEDWKRNMEAEKQLRKLSRQLSKYFEDLVRLKLGYKKVGEGWVTETSLLYIIKSIFPDYNVIHHYRPPELEGLEIDIFIKDLNVGIEYQGIQHYKPIKYWGGEKAFEELKKRDERKARLCKRNGIKLIYFKYNENITESLVKAKLL